MAEDEGEGGMRFGAVMNWLRHQPLKFLWGVVLLTAFVMPWAQRGQAKPGEFYPFSNFPMYSTFSDSTYYVYVTDLKDEPVPVTFLTGKVLSNLKKQYDTELKAEKRALVAGGVKQEDLSMEARRRAGEVVLRWLVPFADEEKMKELGGLKLKQVTIRYGAEGMVKETLDVGEVRVP
jgi:hypothetical protein